MRIAVIDLGTNTFNLSIAEIKENGFKIIHDSRIGVKLGKGGINQRTILPDAQIRAINALLEFKNIIQKKRIHKVKAIATSAVRNAENKNEFMQLVLEKTGFQIEVIEGKREAELIYKGVNASFDLGEEKSLIIDMGGGSTEFIIANRNEIFWKKSFEIGGARLLEKFLPSNPITHDEISKISNFLNESLEKLKQQIEVFKPIQMIGATGPWETLTEMILQETGSDKTAFDFQVYEISENKFLQFSNEIMATTKAERTKHPGIINLRVDMIVVAMILIQTVWKMQKFQRMYYSAYALKEGVFFELSQKAI